MLAFDLATSTLTKRQRTTIVKAGESPSLLSLPSNLLTTTPFSAVGIAEIDSVGGFIACTCSDGRFYLCVIDNDGKDDIRVVMTSPTSGTIQPFTPPFRLALSHHNCLGSSRRDNDDCRC